jgi:alpha-L-fucosidase
MFLTRREAIKLLAAAVPMLRTACAGARESAVPNIASGPFQATRQSLQAYRVPDWFRDAKLGIWAHWGPQSAVEFGDWYARNLYIEGSRQYRHHLKHYGHPSEFGYKDLIPLWTAEAFDPDHLLGLYKKAGAKYFVSLGVHLDNFDLWDSKHTRWNAVRMGPKRDIVGEFRSAARRHGLKFGVSDHLWCSYKWFSVARGSDKRGPLAGVPYDGADPAYVDLFNDCPVVYRDLSWNEDDIPEKWQRHWFARINDLLETYEPDLVYQDGPIPFGQWGLSMVADYYNRNARRHGGRVEAVYTSKSRRDAEEGIAVLDVERGVLDDVWPRPWQMCTCVGNWHYDQTAEYKSPKRIVDLLVDVVSRNGNLMLNFPLRRDGALDERELAILEDLTRWMDVNGEAIHGTRPWKTFGAGPTVHERDPREKYGETGRKDLTARDVRFTTKGKTLYAFFMGWPAERQLTIEPLAVGAPHVKGRVRQVRLVGFPGKINWQHNASGLVVQLPMKRPSHYACALEIKGLDV